MSYTCTFARAHILISVVSLLNNLQVWDDFNGNGVQDEGEPGMPVVIVMLSDKNGNPMMDLATGAEAIITTAADGSYWFTGLAPGEYGRPQLTQAPPLPSSRRRPPLQRPPSMAPIGHSSLSRSR